MKIWRRNAVVVALAAATWPLAVASSPWIAVWPSVVAVVAVLAWRRVLPGLAFGAFIGCLVLENGRPIQAIVRLLDEQLLGSLSSRWNAAVLLFTLLMGVFVGLIESSGGMGGLLRRLLGSRPSKRRVEAATFALGLTCFFDGLANALCVGRVMREPVDQAGIPRARLAWMVDSTAAPVACLAGISTWIAYQLSMIEKGYEQIGLSINPYPVFLESIAHNAYCWLALLLVVVSIRKQSTAKIELDADDSSHPLLALGPLAVLIASLSLGLYASGRAAGAAPGLAGIAEAVGKADTALVLLAAAIIGCLVAWPAARHGGGNPGEAAKSSATEMLGPLGILLGAWMLSSTLKSLGAAAVIASTLEGSVSAAIFPALVFLCGAVISFATGTSWGTMGVLMPLAIPAAAALGDLESLAPAVVAAVFSGAVFGDHCSPMSDTTVISAIACGVDPIDHVRHQLPYALLAACGAAIAFLLAALVPAPLAIAAVAVVIGLFTHRFEAHFPGHVV